jgi:hypothetical protein
VAARPMSAAAGAHRSRAPPLMRLLLSTP